MKEFDSQSAGALLKENGGSPTCPRCGDQVDLTPGRANPDGGYFVLCQNCGRLLNYGRRLLIKHKMRREFNINDEFGTAAGLIYILSGLITPFLYKALSGQFVFIDHLVYYFSWPGTKICPAYFEALAKSNLWFMKPDSALMIYLCLALAIHRFYRPMFRMKYPRIVSRGSWFWLWPANLAVAVFFLFFIYAAPELLLNFFDKPSNFRLSTGFYTLMMAWTGHSLGVVAYAFRSHDLRLCRRS